MSVHNDKKNPALTKDSSVCEFHQVEGTSSVSLNICSNLPSVSSVMNPWRNVAKAAHRSTRGRWVLSSSRRSWTLGSWRRRSAVNSSAGRRAPPAHSAGCICKRQRRIQDMTSSSSSFSSHHAHPTRTFQHSRCFIAFGELQDQLSFWVHSEDARHGNANFLVGKHVLESAGRNGGTVFVSRHWSNIIRD